MLLREGGREGGREGREGGRMRREGDPCPGGLGAEQGHVREADKEEGRVHGAEGGWEGGRGGRA